MKRNLLLSFCSLALVGLLLLAAAVFLAGQLRIRYERQLTQAVWPARMVREPVVDGPLTGRPVVLLFGDSRMAAWSGFAVSNLTVVNAGQSGATTAQLRLLLPGLLDRFHPATVVFQAGINDLKLLGMKPDLESLLVTETANNLSNMVSQCSAHGCRVILLETWPVGRPEWLRRPVWSQTVALGVSRLNERLRLLDAPSRNVRVVNLFQEAGVKPDPDIFLDALHFRLSLYQRLTPALQTELSWPPATKPAAVQGNDL
jgi:lysophospholipase L1-like esterase